MILDYKKREELLAEYNLPRPVTSLTHSQDEAVSEAKRIGFPVVLKTSPVESLHRTESGGVIVGLNSEEEVKEAYRKLEGIEDSEGIIVQKMIKGVELIVGAKNDPTFGPTVMMGTGGVMVELFEDVTFRIAPFGKREAEEMIEEVRGKKLLEGFRGGPVIDKSLIVDILVKTSKLVSEKSIEELDFNPVIIGEKAFICDVKIVS